jgi:lipoyl(octanoyl) transferase
MIEFIDLKRIDYEKWIELMKRLSKAALLSDKDYLVFTTHNPVFTVGKNEADKFPWAFKTDRGGSITYFDEGTLMVYFIFHIKNPAFFYKNVRKSIQKFFNNFPLDIYYDKEKPGFYIQNRKIASLGFSYKNGISNHGVSIHLNPDLEKFNEINPCNLSGIKATSLYNEGIDISIEEAKKIIIPIIKEIFNET